MPKGYDVYQAVEVEARAEDYVPAQVWNEKEKGSAVAIDLSNLQSTGAVQ